MMVVFMFTVSGKMMLEKHFKSYTVTFFKQLLLNFGCPNWMFPKSLEADPNQPMQAQISNFITCIQYTLTKYTK